MDSGEKGAQDRVQQGPAWEQGPETTCSGVPEQPQTVQQDKPMHCRPGAGGVRLECPQGPGHHSPGESGPQVGSWAQSESIKRFQVREQHGLICGLGIWF